jgi:hypothetical protein
MWWLLWSLLAFFWGVTYFVGDVNWTMVALGACTMFVVIWWSIDMLGGIVWASWTTEAGVNSGPEADRGRVYKRPDIWRE